MASIMYVSARDVFILFWQARRTVHCTGCQLFTRLLAEYAARVDNRSFHFNELDARALFVFLAAYSLFSYYRFIFGSFCQHEMAGLDLFCRSLVRAHYDLADFIDCHYECLAVFNDWTSLEDGYVP